MRRVAVVSAGITAFGEHFALGLKRPAADGFSKCAASMDKDLAKSDLQGAWSVPWVPPTGFRPA